MGLMCAPITFPMIEINNVAPFFKCLGCSHLSTTGIQFEYDIADIWLARFRIEVEAIFLLLHLFIVVLWFTRWISGLSFHEMYWYNLMEFGSVALDEAINPLSSLMLFYTETILLERSASSSVYETVLDTSLFKSEILLFPIRRGLPVLRPSSSTRGRTPVILYFVYLL